MSTSTIDVGALPPNAQKILDPNGPAPLKGMAAKGLAPGLKPGETLAVICALSLGTDAHADVAKKTLANLPLPLLNGALAGEVQGGRLHVLPCADEIDLAWTQGSREWLALETFIDT